jgi:hypothetical protein
MADDEDELLRIEGHLVSFLRDDPRLLPCAQGLTAECFRSPRNAKTFRDIAAGTVIGWRTGEVLGGLPVQEWAHRLVAAAPNRPKWIEPLPSQPSGKAHRREQSAKPERAAPERRRRKAAAKASPNKERLHRKQEAVEPSAAKPDNAVGSSKGTISERAAAKVRPPNSSNRHVRLYHQDLETPAFTSLDCKARALLLEFHREYNGHNNGEIVLPVKEAMQRLGIGSTHTMLRAFQALEDRGFIVATSRGAFHAGAKHSTKWELTSWPLAKGAEPRRLFRKWRSRSDLGVHS